MKVAIVGSREYPKLGEVRDLVASLPAGTVVISGGAEGVDSVAAIAARALGLIVWEFKIDRIGLPEYGTGESRQAFAKRARERNLRIVDACDELHAFWDGTSPGTAMTARLAEQAGKPVTTHGVRVATRRSA